MSYDLDVYTAEEPVFESTALKRAEIVDSTTRYVTGLGWQIAIHGPMKVDDEDLPEGIEQVLPGLTFLTQLHVEGEAPTSAYKLAGRIAKSLAKEGYGVVVDEQEDTMETPRSVKRFAPARVESEDLGPICLGWHFMDVDRFSETGFEQLVELIQGDLPELLPRRYGLWEPPQYKWEEHGKEHFLPFANKHRFDVVWYPFKPAEHFHLGIPSPPGPERRGFRVGCIQAEFSGKIAHDTAWRRQLTRVFLRVSSILLPFYGEIRFGATLPQSWWWYGIPKSRGRLTLVGPPYLELWPEWPKSGEMTAEGLVYCDYFTEEGIESVAHTRGPQVPESIAQPKAPDVQVDPASGDVITTGFMGDAGTYPALWPFAGPKA